MDIRLIISISLIFALVSAQSEEEEEICLPLRRSAAIRQTPPPISKGHPGKLGPQGPPGPKGNRGIPGTCGCDPSEIEQLNERIRQLDDSFNERIVKLNNILPPKYFVHGCAVGLKDGRVQDEDITASTEVNSNHAAHQGRLDYVPSSSYSGAWCSRRNRVGEWLQVDLKSPILVTGVITQGRHDGDWWVTSFKISFGNSTSDLQIIEESGEQKVFQGNQDRNTYVMNRFPQPITARYFRLIVQGWYNHICPRLEYITC